MVASRHRIALKVTELYLLSIFFMAGLEVWVQLPVFEGEQVHAHLARDQTTSES